MPNIPPGAESIVRQDANQFRGPGNVQPYGGKFQPPQARPTPAPAPAPSPAQGATPPASGNVPGNTSGFHPLRNIFGDGQGQAGIGGQSGGPFKGRSRAKVLDDGNIKIWPKNGELFIGDDVWKATGQKSYYRNPADGTIYLRDDQTGKLEPTGATEWGGRSSFTPMGANTAAIPLGTNASPEYNSLAMNSGIASAANAAAGGGYYGTMYNAIYDAAVKMGAPNPQALAALGAAQTSLETGYGKHMVGNNAFGIKGSGPKGSVNAGTWEVRNGKRTSENANFRAYESPEQSAADWVKLMMSNSRYNDVWNANSVADAIAAQSKTGYATDPNYGTKLRSIASRAGFL
jgi:hypothetical protein